MNTEIEITTLAEYLIQIKSPADTMGFHYIYRGQKNKTWRVQSSAMRRLLKLKKLDHPDRLSLFFVGYLHQIIDEVKRRYVRTYGKVDPLECMAHLQHHKVATGLIDFTYNPMAALWFACQADSPNEEDGKVFMLNTRSPNIEEIKDRREGEQGLKAFFGHAKKWHLWQPSVESSIIDTDKIIAQQSVFMFGMPEIPNDMFDKALIIPREYKKEVLKELAEVGITEKTLFSDLTGFLERNNADSDYNADLAKHYYIEKIKASEREDEQRLS